MEEGSLLAVASASWRASLTSGFITITYQEVKNKSNNKGDKNNNKRRLGYSEGTNGTREEANLIPAGVVVDVAKGKGGS